MIESLLNTKHWHISEDYYNRIGLKAIALLEAGKSIDILKSVAPAPLLSSALGMIEGELPYQTIINENNERVAIIPLYGTMTKEGGLCSYGTAELAQMINHANAEKGIQAIIMDINTPGGAYNSIEVLDRAIQASEKAIIGYVNDMAASAGLWTASSIASKGKVIVDSLQNSQMGSIGTIYFHENIAAMLKADGIEIEIIRAPQSVDKALINSVEELTDDIKADLLEDMRVMTDGFIDAVKSNYGSSLKIDTPKLFTGGMFTGAEAIDIGLAHEQGDLSHAYHLAIDMADAQTKKSFQMNTTMNMFKNLGLSFSIASKLSTEELENLSSAAERLSEVENNLSQMTEQNGTLTAQVATLEQSIVAKDTLLAENTTKIEELETSLADAPAGQATTVVTDGDGTPPEENKYQTSADEQLAEMKSTLKISK